MRFEDDTFCFWLRPNQYGDQGAEVGARHGDWFEIFRHKVAAFETSGVSKDGNVIKVEGGLVQMFFHLHKRECLKIA